MSVLDRPVLLEQADSIAQVEWLIWTCIQYIKEKQMPMYVLARRQGIFPQEEYLSWLNESKQDGHNILGYRKALLEG